MFFNSKRFQLTMFMLGLLYIVFVPAILAAVLDYGDLTNVKLIRVYDGDSMTVNVSTVHPLLGKSIGVRIGHIDTPEMTGDCEAEAILAAKAKAFVIAMVPVDKVITLHKVRRDKYFRILADVEMGGVDVGTKLIEAGLAHPYEGGTKTSWCN